MSDNERQALNMTRRAILEKLLAGMAAGAVWPVIAPAHPIHRHLMNGTTLDRADAVDAAENWKPLFLNDQQDETLTALSESILPGSAKAQVNRFIDLLLSVDTRENQEKFVASLSAVERSAQATFVRGFHQLSASDKDELLTSLSTGKSPSKHFDDLKEWVTVAYYSSEVGLRELGWTGDHAFRSFPGCDLSNERKI